MTGSFPTRLLAGFSALGIVLGLSAPEPAAAPQPPPAASVDEDVLSYLERPAIDAASAAVFLRAARSARTGQHMLAESTYVQFAHISPSLADWAYVLAADAAARRGDTAAARAHLNNSSGWLAREWGWRARVRALQTAGEPAAAASLALSSAAAAQLPTSRILARRQAAELQMAAGDTAAARATLRTIVHDAPAAAPASSAAQLLTRVSANGLDLLAAARILAAAGNTQAATDLLPRLLANPALASAERAGVRLSLARTHFNARRYTQAERIATALAADTSEPEDLRADARVLVARVLLRRDQRTAATRQLERVLASGMPRAAADAAFVLADLAHDEQDGFNTAATLYRQSAQAAPASTAAGEALMRLGAAAFSRAQFDSAQYWFEQARLGAPALQPRASYWTARARHAAGDSSGEALLRQLAADHPISYYAFRAQEQLRTGSVLALPGGPESSATEIRRMQRAFERWQLLQRAELSDMAAFELDRLRRSFASTPEVLYLLAERMHGDGQTQRAILLGRELQQLRGAWDQRLLRIVYPLPFQQLIESEALKVGVDPYLAAALIRQESAFNPRATSVAGARGLMQLMPATGRKVAAQASVPRFQVARLYEPAFNVKLGMHHLKTLLDEYAGNLPHVLSAYNAGAHRLVRWQDFPESFDDELFVERIPFVETRDYVRIVQQNANIYRALYGK